MYRGFSLKGYLFEELIGAGGMGEIWAAKRISLGDRVAIKVLKVGANSNADQLKEIYLKKQGQLLLFNNLMCVKCLNFRRR